MTHYLTPFILLSAGLLAFIEALAAPFTLPPHMAAEREEQG